MIKTGDILKKMRKNRNISQKELCIGIITRQTYSKIENNFQEPNFEILNLLLKRMNYEIDDFSRELHLVDKYDEYYKLFLRGIQGDLTIKEAEDLFNYVSTNRSINNRFFHFYAATKGHLHIKYPTVIPTYNLEDKNLFKILINNTNFFYSIYDLKMIGDFATHLLSYSELISLYSKLPVFSPFKYGEDSQIYRTQIHKIYNNFCDMAIFNEDLDTAKKLIKQHKEFSEIHLELRYLMYIKINEATIEYKENNRIDSLDPLLEIINSLNLVKDYNTARAVQYQYDVLVHGSEYNSTNSIAYD